MNVFALDDLTTDCPYIRGRVSVTESFLCRQLGAADLDRALEFGFRHFGVYFFRPVCPTCKSCLPLRIPLSNYEPRRSARRLLARNAGLRCHVTAPAPSKEAYALYRLHLRRFDGQGESSYDRFVQSFFSPLQGNAQMSVYDGDKTVAIMHLDVTALSMSAVYCYYDDDYHRESLGSYAIFRALEMARENGLRWFYLGYLVEENRHMAYKARFRPSEVLSLRGWVPFMDAEGRCPDPGAGGEGFAGSLFRDAYGSCTGLFAR